MRVSLYLLLAFFSIASLADTETINLTGVDGFYLKDGKRKYLCIGQEKLVIEVKKSGDKTKAVMRCDSPVKSGRRAGKD